MNLPFTSKQPYWVVKIRLKWKTDYVVGVPLGEESLEMFIVASSELGEFRLAEGQHAKDTAFHFAEYCEAVQQMATFIGVIHKENATIIASVMEYA